MLKAIATYERTIVTGDTPFDRWIRGDAKAMSDAAQRGFALFNGKAHCAACHTGWNFTDDKFHDIGLPTDDKGRMGVSKQRRRPARLQDARPARDRRRARRTCTTARWRRSRR